LVGPTGSSLPMLSSSPSWAIFQVERLTSARTALRRPCSGVPRGLAFDAEDPRHDHVERDGLHPRCQGQRLTDRPAIDFAFGGVGDHLRVTLDCLAVEGRQQQLALAHVARADRRQHGVRPQDRPKRRLTSDRRRILRPGGEQRPDVVRVARDDVLVTVGVHAPDLAQGAPSLEDELDLALVEAKDLHGPGKRHHRRRGQRGRLLGGDGPGRRRRCLASGQGDAVKQRSHARNLHR
jgi:hypothetical protein